MTTPSVLDPAGARARKYRQAAIVYLHMALLYEIAVIMAWQQGLVHRGSPVVWLVAGALVGVGVSYALYRWHKPWLPWVLWALSAFRLQPLARHAFVEDVTGALTRGFYITAIVVIVINMWMLARAAWDL